MSKTDNMIGRRFGRLTVLERTEDYLSPGGTKMRRFLCCCDCGGTIIATGCNIRNGNTLSCGCLRREISAKHAKQYFHTNTSSFADDPRHRRLYLIWYDMVRRCNNACRQNFKDYGGRGISVCEEWLGDYDSFAKWAIHNGYAEELTLDRIDCNGDYRPDNCRWATLNLQANNKRSNRYLSLSNGETHTITEWSRMFGINRHTIAQRIRNGWPVDDAVTRPVKSK